VAAVAAVHPPALRLAGQVGVHQAGPRGRARAGRDHAGRRAVAARHHGELVGPGRRAVVQVRRAARLEGARLALGGARVRRRQVGVVVGAAQRHGGGHGRRGVGEGARVVHPGAGEARLRQRGEARELALKLTRERAQVGGTWWRKRGTTSSDDIIGQHHRMTSSCTQELLDFMRIHRGHTQDQ